jgi:DNA primase
MTTKTMNEAQITDLLYYLGSAKVKQINSKGNIQACCPVHGEHTPSMGVSVEKQLCNCFSCHFSGTIPWLVFNSDKSFKSVDEVIVWLKGRYDVDFSVTYDLEDLKALKKYEEQYVEALVTKRKVLELSYIAVFKSGKETYEYFYSRGFTKQTVKDFMIGRDLKNKTITVPIFYEDRKLAGVIGRYISSKRRKNERYKIYEETPTGDILFPQDKIKPIHNTCILVEGLLDGVYMHQCGYSNTGAMLTNNLSKKQAKWLRNNCRVVIDMTDDDEMGKLASESIKKQLGDTILIKTVKHLYPMGKKDPQDCSKEEIDYMIANARSIIRKELKRL